MRITWILSASLAAGSICACSSSSSGAPPGDTSATDASTTGDGSATTTPVSDAGMNADTSNPGTIPGDAAATDGGASGEGGAPPTCSEDAGGCVACGAGGCTAPATCCGEGDAQACASSCSASVSAACDGPEDCAATAGCCVSFVSEPSMTSNATAVCNPDGCTGSNGSTSTGAAIESVACHTSDDCAGVQDQFEVPYENCCFSPGYAVGACISDTYVDIVTMNGGHCN